VNGRDVRNASSLRAWQWRLAAIFAVAVGLRAAYLVQAPAHPLHGSPFALADSLLYHAQARALLSGQWIGETAYFLAPLYGHLLAALHALFGPAIGVVYATQALLGAASCALLADIGRRSFGPRVGFVAGLAFALYAPHVYYTGHLLPSVSVVFLNLLFVWILLCDAGAPSVRRAGAAGFVLGLAVLAKSNAAILLPAVLGAFAWFHRALGWPRRLRWGAAFALAVLLALAPAVVHNFVASGQFVPVTTSTGRNLWKGNGPIANGTHPLGHWQGDRSGVGRQLRGEVDASEAVDESASYTARTLEHVRAHPGATIRLLGRKLVLFFNAVELGVRDQYYFAKERVAVLRAPLLGFGLVAPLGIAGLVFTRRRLAECWPVSLLFFCQLVSFVGVFVLARYRLVAAACLVVFASERVVAWWDAARGGRWRAAVPSLALAVAAAIGVNLPLAEFPRERGYALQWERIGDQQRLAGEPGEALAAYERALVGDWQDLDPRIKRGETRLRMARTRVELGDIAGARALLRELLFEATADDVRTQRLVRDARALAEELPGG
jgi:4-amino-4-deoxy-L-arabinose transferase-like glycosyltransferase